MPSRLSYSGRCVERRVRAGPFRASEPLEPGEAAPRTPDSPSAPTTAKLVPNRVSAPSHLAMGCSAQAVRFIRTASGARTRLTNGISMPTSSDLATRLNVFIASDPGNQQNHA